MKKFDFQNLLVYKKSKSFYSKCLQISDSNKFEPYEKSQLRRAAFSVPLNIAEGSGKFSRADRRNFFVISRASLFECVAVLDIQLDQEKITSDEFYKLFSEADELSRILYSMIKNLS